ncbi:MAG TPA: LacI family DNA-binding transcriptional regulator [Myxococcales bacterium]|nr:LacI family DNA-binding transcriptional regulator [Myxococcales bacterium]
MARPRVTLRDVARRVGVHPSTVSRALNPATRGLITEGIARRVTRAAARLGYRLNPIAYGLKTNRSRTVGVLVPDITNPVFPPIIRGIEDALAEAGYTAILANTDNDAGRERVILENMFARRVDGLILATARRRDPVVERCIAEDLPAVLINRMVDSGAVSSVVNDDAFGVQLVVRHLIDRGHTRIAHLAGPLTLSTGNARHRSFLSALKAAGLRNDARRVVACGAFSESEGRLGFLELWRRDRSFTAVVAANDLLALGCYDAARELGVRVPDDLAVTGFNDMPFVDKLQPPLTTVRIPHYRMGAQAARTLVARLHNRDAPVEHVTLRPELVVRASTAALEAAGRGTARVRAVRSAL